MEFVFTPTPQAGVYWAFTLLWLAEFVLFRSRPAGEQPARRWGTQRIALCISLSFASTGAFYHFEIGNLHGQAAGWIRSSGLVFYGGGILLRNWAAWSLGSWFSRRVQAEAGQDLVSRGPYRCLRHPLYLGLLLAALGMNLLMANAPGFLLAVTGVVRAIHGRMQEEEDVLEAGLGPRYARWKESRYRLLPFIY